MVDASSSPLFLGIPTNKGWESTVSVPEQAMEGLFRGIRQLFLNRIDSLRDVDAVYYCCGPGSTLGLRLAAAMVKTMIWKARGRLSFFQYNTLDLANCMTDEKPSYIQAPFRLGRRFVRSGKELHIGKKQILTEEDALAEFKDSLHLIGPRQISIDIPQDKILSYDPSRTGGLRDLANICEPLDQPVPYSPEPATFKKWDGQIPAKQSGEAK